MFKQTEKILLKYVSLVVRKVNVKTRYIKYVFGLAACLLFSMLAQPALAAPPGGHEPGAHLDIISVAVDSETGTITISGNDFDFGGLLVVTLGGEIIHNENSGDPLLCPNPSPQEIVCDLSFDGLPVDGDYELIVSTGNGQSASDGYDLTIGAVGPYGLSAYEVAVVDGFVGPEAEWLASLVGDQGADGADGVDGAPGTDGTDGAQGVPGTDGADGAQGVPGTAGAPGADGADGAQGVPGTAGADGANGTDGLACWDLNADGFPDVDEDLNSDGQHNTEDCVSQQATSLDLTCQLVASQGLCGVYPECETQTACGSCDDRAAGCTVFVTSTTMSGALKGMLGADAICQDLADAAGIGKPLPPSPANPTGTLRRWARRYKAWLSTPYVNAVDRMTSYTTPIYNHPKYHTTNNIIAVNMADLIDGGIVKPINVDEYGVTQPTTGVWTNTRAVGGVAYSTVSGEQDCDGWFSNNSAKHAGAIGHNNLSGAKWSIVDTGIGCAYLQRLYCFEQ